MEKYLFVDTNIFLDFYRVRNDVGMALLNHLDSISEKLIVSYQVEMEFKKNRQHAILETLNHLKAPNQVPRPGFMSEDKSYKALQKNISESAKRIGKLKERLQRVFKDPVRNDPVYKVVQRILNKDDGLNLTREDPIKNRIRRQAFRRFMYGYPPRKKNDTSIGDAVNWEWICEVCLSQNAEILICSRDSDFGVTLGNSNYVNDWLKEEFRDRVSKSRNHSHPTGFRDLCCEIEAG